MAKNSGTLRSETRAFDVRFTVQVWKEDGTFVSYAPGLDISSCGKSIRQAKSRLLEAAGLFLEEASRLGTLQEILSESGFVKRGKTYEPHRVLAKEKVRLAIPLAS